MSGISRTGSGQYSGMEHAEPDAQSVVSHASTSTNSRRSPRDSETLRWLQGTPDEPPRPGDPNNWASRTDDGRSRYSVARSRMNTARRLSEFSAHSGVSGAPSSVGGETTITRSSLGSRRDSERSSGSQRSTHLPSMLSAASGTRSRLSRRHDPEFGLGPHLADVGRSSSISSTAANIASKRWGVRIDDAPPTEFAYEASEAGSSSSRDDASGISYSRIRHERSVNKRAQEMLARAGDQLPDTMRADALEGRGPYVRDRNPSTGRSVLSAYDSMVAEQHRRHGPQDWERKERLSEARDEQAAYELSRRMAGLDVSEDPWGEEEEE